MKRFLVPMLAVGALIAWPAAAQFVPEPPGLDPIPVPQAPPPEPPIINGRGGRGRRPVLPRNKRLNTFQDRTARCQEQAADAGLRGKRAGDLHPPLRERAVTRRCRRAASGEVQATARRAYGVTDVATFKPKTVYVTYIAATPEKVWQALTSAEFTKQYFFGRAVEIEPKQWRPLSSADGRMAGCDVSGEVAEWSPPRRLAGDVAGRGDERFRRPAGMCSSATTSRPSGEAAKLTMSESHSWDVPRDLLRRRRDGLAENPLEPQEPVGNGPAARAAA